MANYFARKAGNVNATDVWATTPTGTAADVFGSFTSSDVLHSNSFNVTLNVDTTVGEVRSDTANGATTGGKFILNAGITLTADVFCGNSGTTGCVDFSAVSPNEGYIVGNLTGGATGNNSFACSNNGSGTLNVTGNVTGGTQSGGIGANNNSSGTLNIVGNITGGSGTAAHGARNQSSGTLSITGSSTGGTAGASDGSLNNSTGTLTISGSSFAAETLSNHGATNASTGTLSVIRAVGNSYGIGAAGGVSISYALNSTNISSDTRAEELEFGTNGMTPIFGAVKIVSGTNNKCLVTLTTSAVKTLADPSDGTGQANEADVRSGVSYALGNKTGTCAVPAANSVAFGVAVDNTTGTAVLTPSAVWDALTSGMTTSGSIGARLKNAATLDSTGQQLADALSPVP